MTRGTELSEPAQREPRIHACLVSHACYGGVQGSGGGLGGRATWGYNGAPAPISSSAFCSLGARESMKELTENTALPGPGGP